MIAEIMKFASDDFRLVMWVLVIGTINYSVLFVVPLLITAKCCHRIFGKAWIPAGLLFGGLYMLLILNQLTYEVCQKQKIAATIFNKILYSVYVMKPDVQFSLISKAGVCMISVLSGFGCVNFPFQMFRYYNPLVTQINKENIENDMKSLIKETNAEKLSLFLMGQKIRDA